MDVMENEMKYMNWISRELCNALDALNRANKYFVEMNALNLIDFQEASGISHYLERAMLPVQDALDFVDDLTAELAKGKDNNELPETDQSDKRI